MIAIIPPYLTLITVAVLIVAVAMILYLNADNDRLSESQFDPELHVCIDDVESVLDVLYFSSESLPDDTTYRAAYKCGYQAAILAMERRLNEVCDSSTSNKH